MQVSAQQLNQLLKGQIEGDASVCVSQPAKIEEAQAGSISFLGNMKYEAYAYTTKASILLVPMDFEPKQPIHSTLIRVADVYSSLSLLLDHFGAAAQGEKPTGIAASAVVAEDLVLGEAAIVGAQSVIESKVEIGRGTHIHPQVYVGEGVTLGADCVIFPGVRILKGCKIGDRVVIHSNAVIGSDGFGFAPQEDGSFKKVPQLGIVELQDDVEIGANTVIDRATMGATVIEQGAKLDNLIQIAHNVRVGAHSVLAAQAGMAGSSTLGARSMVGGQVGIVGHITLGEGTRIQAQSGVTRPTKEGEAIYGSPALPYNDYLKAYAVFRKLPALRQEVQALRKALRALEGEQDHR